MKITFLYNLPSNISTSEDTSPTEYTFPSKYTVYLYLKNRNPYFLITIVTIIPRL